MIYVFAENQDNKVKKAAKEAVSFAAEIAKMNNQEVCAVGINTHDLNELGKYGADQLINLKSSNLEAFAPAVYAKVLHSATQGGLWVMPGSSQAMAIVPFLAHETSLPLVTNVLELPEQVNPIVIKRKSFSGKGIQKVKVDAENSILQLSQNAFGLMEHQKNPELQEVEVNDVPEYKVQQTHFEASGHGQLDVKEAEIVVSAGRGLKGPENWGMIEELADLLGAATACSKPVSDVGWRPHSEHVGQTGKAISPNLYIAIGISGAIQHLAGVSSSKTIVVVNTDPEAPFFKSADYGVVGDAFDVVPKLIEEIRKVKSA